MPSMIFNSPQYAKRLEAGGFTRQQAETQANMLCEIVDEKMAIKRNPRELEYRLTIRFGAMLAIAVTVLAGLITFLK